MAWVVNAAGEREEFVPEKVLRTCLRAGAGREAAQRIVDEVSAKVRDGMTTRQILKMTLKLLEKVEEPHVVARYDLKGAIMRLGPAGFPFETFFGEVMREHGYAVKLRQLVEGRCIVHEVDIVAEKGGERSVVECKYRNAMGEYIGIKDALYTYARFLDLKEGRGRFNAGWLVTNTKFSGDVLQYAQCVGLRLTGWKHPPGASLEELVEKKLLYPITVLRTLDAFSQERLARANLMLCRDVATLGLQELHERTGIPKRRLGPIIAEAEMVCMGHEQME